MLRWTASAHLGPSVRRGRARTYGLSRSVFAACFTQLVGEPPLGYLTRLRMQKAAALLRDGAKLAEASRLTGYASEASFS
jgi:AraC-like DNA-binding protein